MIPRRSSSIVVSQLEKCIQDYLSINPQLIERRQHFALIRGLDFLRKELGAEKISDLLKMSVRDITLGLQKYVNYLVGEGKSVKSIRFNLYLVRTFFSFFDVEINPKKLKVPRKSGRTRIDRIPSLAELQKLVSGTKSPRMRMAIMLMCLCGLRLNECLGLRREWIDLERGYITLPAEATKVGRAREVPIPSELKSELKRFLEKYPHPKGYIFCSRNNPEKRVPRSRFYETYHELLKRLGLDAKTPDGSAYVLHPHVFRKWYRTMLESAGVNKLLIDLWMGHNSGSVERLYYLPTPEIIKQEFEKADKALKIFGQTYAPMSSEKAEALEEAVAFYEKLIDHISKTNPRLLRMLGLE
ncbi:MAG: tyrosine-type recombinase/integrase [Aigarchaeota archaeon]|nr:tyrosine-type recombinase/integrase [Candidatus Calditenuaceae archaeon]